jgi:hypothetical protein
VSTEPADARTRRYLMGEASDEECAAIEQQYFEHDEALERMEAAEDDLIEDYLSDRLEPAERERFERRYLSLPHRRARVDTIRRLRAAASRPSAARGARRSAVIPMPATTRPWSLTSVTSFTGLAAAAVLLLAMAGTLWMFTSSRADRPAAGNVVENRPAVNLPSGPAPAPQRVFAVTLSPAAVRSASDTAAIVVPADTGIVALQLEGEAADRGMVSGRASIRTVGGDEVWQGPAAVGADLPPDVIAHVDVPAAKLPKEDYVVTLFGTGPAGPERERSRYYLRIR